MPFHIFLLIKAVFWSLQTAKWHLKSQQNCAEWKLNMAFLICLISNRVSHLCVTAIQSLRLIVLYCLAVFVLSSSYCLNFLSVYPSSFPSLFFFLFVFPGLHPSLSDSIWCNCSSLLRQASLLLYYMDLNKPQTPDPKN